MGNYPENHAEMYWHSTDEPPENDDYIILRFVNYSLPMIGRCEGNESDGFTFYLGDDTESCSSLGLFVDAWMPTPKRQEE